MKIRAKFFFGLSLIAAFLIPSLEAKKIIKDKSPNGRYALELSRIDDGQWSADIVDLKSKGSVASLELYQNMIDGARLVWSKDSQRVAYFEPDRRGGSTTVYFRKEPDFELVELPEFPECKRPPPKEGESHVKTIEATTKPQKWLSSGALMLRVHFEELMEKEDEQYSQPCTQIVTITFDSNHKASVKTAK